MSLNAFHIFFIILSILLDGFVAIWSAKHSQIGLLIFAAISGIALLAYLIYKLKKSNKELMALLILFILPKSAYPCSVCFGVLDYQTRSAVNNAVWFLIAVTAFMLGLLTYFVMKSIKATQNRSS